mgnify:FL=1
MVRKLKRDILNDFQAQCTVIHALFQQFALVYELHESKSWLIVNKVATHVCVLFGSTPTNENEAKNRGCSTMSCFCARVYNMTDV